MTYISWSIDFVLYLGDYLMYEHDYLGIWISMTRRFDLKITVGHCDQYFMVQWFWDLLKTILCFNIILQDYWSVWSDIWPQCKYRSLWPVFHGPVILPYIYFMIQWFCLVSWRLFDVWTSIFGIMNQYDPMFDFKIIVGHCDLYFMVHWFCVISWRLFDVWTWLFGNMNQYDQTFWSQNNCRSLWPIFHGLVILRSLEDYFMLQHHTSGLLVSMIRHLTSM